MLRGLDDRDFQCIFRWLLLYKLTCFSLFYSYEKSYQKLLEAAVNNDLALKGNIDEIELLIFPSSMLPASSQRKKSMLI